MTEDYQHFVMNGSLARRSVGAIFVFFPTVIAAILGGLWFGGLIGTMLLLASLEMVTLVRLAGFSPSRSTGLMACATGIALVILPHQNYVTDIATVLLLASIAWQMHRNTPRPISDWSMPLLGGLYIGWAGAHLIALRSLPDGFWWLALAIGATWLSDSGAYFIGRWFGKSKLAPNISPKKTWEGYLGGVATAVMFALILSIWSPLGLVTNLIGCVAVGIFGTFGDLAESMFKRQAKAKDSGILIPGQGGAFDRLDSLLWSGVAVWLVATYFAKAVPVS